MGVEWGICMSSPAKTVCALDFKFAIQREQGWGHPHCKFQTNPLKSVPTALIVRKRSFLAENIGFGHSTLTRCSCHIQQRQKLPTGI